jgi:predicted Zn-dependent protease with MMP-like domain
MASFDLTRGRGRCFCVKVVLRGSFRVAPTDFRGVPDYSTMTVRGLQGERHISRRQAGRSWLPTVAARMGDAGRFESLVRDAIDALPDYFRRRLENVEIVIEDIPARESLLGHYHGVPLTQRGAGYSGFLPDKITIYRQPLERRATSPENLAEQVRVTVWHEIAHHFGIDDERLRELGMG